MSTDGITMPSPTQPPTPTLTRYQQLANEVMAALDEMEQLVPKLEAEHISTARFVRSHVNIPIKFLETATAGVEQIPELQGVKKLDVVAARDTLQLIDAFSAVRDKVSTFDKNLQFMLNCRQVSLASGALQIYDIAKGLARDSNDSGPVALLVENLKRDLGRKGPSKTTLALRKKGTPTPGIGVPTPRLLAQEVGSDDPEPRG